jgi:RluA family pseudouridine synthase
MRLIDHLRSKGMSNREAQRAMETGKVYVRDAPTADAARDVDPKHVSVRMNAPRITVGRDPIIIHRDDHLAVVVKPAGMLSTPAPGRKDTSIISETRRVLGDSHAVHRLDEPTSGVMMVARTVRAQQALKDMFEAHDVERVYLAIVRGQFSGEARRVHNMLVRDRGDGLRGEAGPSETGKVAVTDLELVSRPGADASIVKATLETGRTHQVRIHLSELGYPILGDRLYGEGAARAAPRLALHAHVLGFRHPFSRERLRFVCPLADDLERFVRKLNGPRRSFRRR